MQDRHNRFGLPRSAYRASAAFAAVIAALTLDLAPAIAAPAIGSKPATVVLKGDLGGRVDGSEWSSESLRGKVWALFYVDPDEKDSNLELEKALDAEKFPSSVYGSVAVINMDATWLPNAAISSSLKAKQKDYPNTVYVKDMKKALVKDWQMKDDAYAVLVFDREGRVVFAKDGTFAKGDIDAMIVTIRQNLESPH